jgi:glycosyltransferase involved in cell wall biosynthesis
MDDAHVSLFSVLLPTRNRPERLRQAIASVAGQTLADWELIVVDDGSDPRVDVPRNGRVRLVRLATHGGPASARNAGIAFASGRYIAFLDDDDLVTADRLEIASRALRSTGRTVSRSTKVGMESKTSTRGFESRLQRLSQRCRRSCTWCRRTTADPERLRQRVEENHLLLEVHRPYFESHRCALTFRLKRIGLMSLALGERAAARRVFARSLRSRPTAATGWHLVRSSRPRGRCL